jgi:hypothetical protein
MSGAFANLHEEVAATMPSDLHVKDGKLWLHGRALVPKYGRRGIQIGCTFVTYEALDYIYEESQK